MKSRPLHAIAGGVITSYSGAMEIAITKGRRDDRIAIRRTDGSTAETRFSKKGPVPHDAVHYFVERSAGLTAAFWGLVAQGRHPEELAELAKVGGHASAKRAGIPDADIVQLIQVERLVECFEAELWSDGADNAALREIARAGWSASLVPGVDLSEDQLEAIRAGLGVFAAGWIAAPEGYVADLTWD